MTKILLSGASEHQNYVDAVRLLGAEVNAGYLPEVAPDCDGLILCGGSDIHPGRYGEEIDGSVDIDLARDEVEFALLEAYIKAGKPILGICRGHQLINVFFGGSLWQDIPEAALHTRKNGRDAAHTVNAIPDSVVGRLYGERFAVNSSHHQALKAVGKGLRVTARWEDSRIEAIEHETLPIIGVQWHPERMCFRHKREDTVCGEALLRYFIDLCRTRGRD